MATFNEEIILDFAEKENKWCDKCPEKCLCNIQNNPYHVGCVHFKRYYPIEYYKAMIKQLYPTNKDKFFEMHPKAQKDRTGYPLMKEVCKLGWNCTDFCDGTDCHICWNMPYINESENNG